MRISDWSSDVCSSDLSVILSAGQGSQRARCRREKAIQRAACQPRRIAASIAPMLSRVFPDRFVPVLLATLLLASLLPVRGGAVPVAQAVSTAAIIFLFFLNGVRVPRDEVRHGIRNWKLDRKSTRLNSSH